MSDNTGGCDKRIYENASPAAMRPPGRLKLSKKWPCHFFEKASLRSAPQLSADSGQFDAHSAQSVFRHAHVAAENRSYCFRVCGRETLRGFFDMLCLTGGHAAAGEVLSVHLISPNLCFFTKAPYYPNSFCQKPFLSFSVYLISFINSYLSNAGFNRSGIVTLVRL